MVSWTGVYKDGDHMYGVEFPGVLLREKYYPDDVFPPKGKKTLCFVIWFTIHLRRTKIRQIHRTRKGKEKVKGGGFDRQREKERKGKVGNERMYALPSVKVCEVGVSDDY